jgi:antitoxin component of RelBE/YafQ-DinJ toxin-antitoxin module
MSYLEKYARNQEAKKTEIITIRTTKELKEAFARHCASLGLSIGEAINILIEREMKEAGASSEPLPKQAKKQYTLNQLAVGGKLPCPICNGWFSRANFNRHAKTKHGMTTKEIFARHGDQAFEMRARAIKDNVTKT